MARTAAPGALPLLALALVLSPAAAAEEARARCEVAGYDVLLFNDGAAAIPAGRTLVWRVPFARAEGRHRLGAALAPGRFVLLTGALGETYLRPTVPCLASVE